MVKNPLRKKFQANQQTFGLWVTMESPSITEIAATMGLDWVSIDMEHGHLGFKEVMEHVRAVRGSDTAILIRVPDFQQDLIKRALDIGAHGVLLPLIGNSRDMEKAMSYGRYPVKGVRGIGGERSVKWGLGMQDYLNYADQETLIIPMIETKEAVNQSMLSLMCPVLKHFSSDQLICQQLMGILENGKVLVWRTLSWMFVKKQKIKGLPQAL